MMVAINLHSITSGDALLVELKMPMRTVRSVLQVIKLDLVALVFKEKEQLVMNDVYVAVKSYVFWQILSKYGDDAHI